MQRMSRRRKGTPCLVVFPPPGSDQLGAFNGTPCHVRHDLKDAHQALCAQGCGCYIRHYSDGWSELRFRVPLAAYLEVRDALVSLPIDSRTTCARKVRYACEDAALAAAASIIMRPRYHNLTDAPLVPYVCDDCSGWHVGHRYKIPDKVGLLLPRTDA